MSILVDLALLLVFCCLGWFRVMLVYDGKPFFSDAMLLARKDIHDLCVELDLELIRVVRYPRGFVPKLDSVEYPPLVISAQVSDTSLCQKMCERNHHRKDFSNVYQSDSILQNLSFDWD